MHENMYISFVGPSGSGKSTCFAYVEKYLSAQGFTVLKVNVAHPLRAAQSYCYSIFRKESQDPLAEDFRQDGALLGFLAAHFEDSLGVLFRERFAEALKGCAAGKVAVVNTDCRNNTYETLRSLGFVFVRISSREDVLAERRLHRGDLTLFDHNASVEAYDRIVCESVIANNGTREDLDKKVEQLLRTRI